MRVVLDSNVIIAAFAGRGLCLDILSVCVDKHKIVASEQIMEEVHRNLTSKIKVSAEISTKNVAAIREIVEMVAPVKVEDSGCRDLTDTVIIGTAVAGSAEVIVSGDKDLLAVGEYRSIRVLTPRKFWEMLAHK